MSTTTRSARMPRSCKRAKLPLRFCLALILLTPWGLATGCRAEEPAQGPAASRPAGIHRSPIAGSWYPDDPLQLRTRIQDLLARVPPQETRDAGPLVALIVPHAAYAYSGQTAAAGYRILREHPPKRVILLGPSHRVSFHGVSFADYAAYETPLGQVPVDPEARRILAACPQITFDPRAHVREHSLDIQIPFLQVLFSPPPPIVPLVVGDLHPEDYPAIARCLSPLLDPGTVVVVSSDFTHYGPQFSYLPFPCDDFTANKLEVLDDGACRKILAGDTAGFLAYRKRTGITVCGYRPIALLLEMLPPGTRGDKISYDTSGRQTGDYHHSVSYVTLAFYNPWLWGPRTDAPPAHSQERETMRPDNDPVSQPEDAAAPLHPSERGALLRLARDTLEQYVRNGKRPDPEAPLYAVTPRLRTPRGAFVTLKRHGDLRGCIGYILPVEPLLRTVQENTVNACSRDTRFAPVRPDELPDIHLEISVLSVPEPVSSFRQIRVGRHGIVLKNGSRRAVFLPQVAVEQGWDLEETLRQLSRKAGLSAAAWKDPETEYEVFTAEIIEEDVRRTP